MNTRLTQRAAWIAYANAIAAILNFVTLALFFALEAPEASANPSQGSYSWGTLNDIIGCLAMAPMLLLALTLYQMENGRARRLSVIALIIGVIGMSGVALLQLLLVLKVIPFEQEVGPVVIANGVIGLWLILVNYLGQSRTFWSARLAWLGIVTGASFMAAPLIFSALGGALAWQAMMSNPVLLTACVLVFSLMYVGFPIWAFWLGRALTSSQQESVSTLPQVARVTG